MRQRVTITIDSKALSYVDRSARRRKVSRSRLIEAFVEQSRRRDQEDGLRRMAKEFFGAPSPEEEQEREDWLKMSLQTQERAD
jgi:metal-responsive CopG/Arc/MetJ family transcriptional regulator